MSASFPGFRSIGARYQLINELGHGGMGSVYRALDRLTGRVVTLKRLRLPAGVPGAPPDGSRHERFLLAQEFRLLSSLRHPNIVSVLDYGFDEDREPYLTMDLEENARTITEAGAAQAIALRVDLLVQMLRALAYLHRHGIIHRDLKPENVVVVGDQVKVLDFGLSLSRDAAERERGGFAGTLQYLAPEMLQGAPPSEQCDLYAVGVIAYELLVGSYPYPQNSALTLSLEIAGTPLPRPSDPVDSRFRPILERLLAKHPEERCRDAAEVIAALAVALDQPLAVETVVTRESFLQSAPLVGREEELATLTGILRAAARGRGGAWLVCGESGVGKSRLLDEVRTQALVDGFVVARGQAVGQGGGPYHVWRDAISRLVLRPDLPDAEAAVLKAVVPEISLLLRRDIADAPGIDLEATQSRLFVSVEELFRQQATPVVVILEDLQWAGSESLKMLGWLAQAVQELPLVLLGSFRDDDAPRLRDLLPRFEVLRLRRLDAQAIAALGECMIGPAGRRTDLVALLERETEGIPFFLVEVVRALAERAGGLAQIGAARLPERIISGGMQKVIRRRLEQVPPDALAALKTAAVAGRLIDTQLLRAMHPEVVVDEWLARCAEAAVLELRDQQWRFAHDKLREQLLQDLVPASRQALHRRVAEAVEREYPGRADRVMALAYHWREAAEPGKEASYAYEAGVLALQNGACEEAVGHLSRALDILRTSVKVSAPGGTPAVEAVAAPTRRASVRSILDPNRRVDPASREFRLGLVEGWLAEAHFRLGDLTACGEHAVRALRHFGQYVPTGRVAWVADTLRQAALRCIQAAVGVRPADPGKSSRVATEVVRVQGRVMEMSFYSLRAVPLVWSTLGLLNHCQPVGPRPEQAYGYLILGHVANGILVSSLADAWCRRALDIAEQIGTPRDVAWMLSRNAAYQVGRGWWADADAGLHRAVEITRNMGDLRLWAECYAQMGLVALYSGQFERGLQAWAEAERLSRRSDNRQVECWALIGRADILVRLGLYEEALVLYDQGIRKIDLDAMKTEVIWAFGMSALARLRTGDERGAYEAADRALAYIVGMTPVAYWTLQGMAATAEVFLALHEGASESDGRLRSALAHRARGACRGLRRYRRRMALGGPHTFLWCGLQAWLSGRRSRAFRLWRRTLTLAEALQMPYERARAAFEIGRHLAPDADGRRHHLHQAADLFERIGAAADLERARRELSTGEPALPARRA